jgi:hypothetical protein
MDNYSPSQYERIDEDLDALWKKWRRVNGNVVNIYDSQKECLRDWWQCNSAEVVRAQKDEKVIYDGKLTKDIFIEYPDGYYILFTQYPLDSYELSLDREELWKKIKSRNGKKIRIFENHVHCAIFINKLLEMG